MSQDQFSNEITVLLKRWEGGDRGARDELIGTVYDELRALAHRQLGREFSSKTINTTDLVHEAFLKLVKSDDVSWESRAHFFAIAARQMRQILVDRARTRRALKRGGGLQLKTLNESMVYEDERAMELIDIDSALTRLSHVNERAARVVEMRFFVGLTTKEIGKVIGVSGATVERDWTMARAWLSRELAS